MPEAGGGIKHPFSQRTGACEWRTITGETRCVRFRTPPPASSRQLGSADGQADGARLNHTDVLDENLPHQFHRVAAAIFGDEIPVPLEEFGRRGDLTIVSRRAQSRARLRQRWQPTTLAA